MGNIITILNTINDAIFVSLINTTLQMTLLIPLIVLVIWLFRIQSAATRYSLWLFVLFGMIVLPLLTPFIPQMDFAQFHRQRATGDGPDDLMRLRMGGSDVGELSEGDDSVSSTSATKAAVNKEMDVSLINPVSVAYFIWCAGAFFMFCVTLDAYRRLRKLKISSPDVKEHSALEMLSRLKDKLKIRRPIALKVSSEIYTPVSFGIFSHTIILPNLPVTARQTGGVIDGVTPPLEKGVGGISELEMILTHELAHIKRCDYLINFLQNMLKVIFYFHPLFHLMNRNLTREREHICDNWVIDVTRRRRGYAECIIGLLERALYQPLNVPLTIAMAERRWEVRRRIEMIMDKKRKITTKASKKALIGVFLIGCLTLAFIGGIELVRFAGARPASNEGWIVFRRAGQGIWIMDVDGKNEKQLTTVGTDTMPVWSPDGRQIAFVSWTDNASGYDIYIMNADGSNRKQLTTDDMDDYTPTWLPDGKQIAFSSQVWKNEGGNMELKSAAIRVIDSDGANLKKLTEGPPFFGDPAWSPDGTKIACTEIFKQGKFWFRDKIWVMDVDGGNREMLHNSGSDPDWSPDGKRVVFSFSGIYVMDADGSDVKMLTNPGPLTWDAYPCWSPDGTKIAFSSNRDGNHEIYVMNADGSNVQRLTNTPANEFQADWIAYSHVVEPTGKLMTIWGKIKHELFSR